MERPGGAGSARALDVGGELQSAGFMILCDNSAQSGLVERDFRAAKALHFTLIDVGARDVVTYIREACPCYQTYVSAANDCNFHCLTLESRQ